MVRYKSPPVPSTNINPHGSDGALSSHVATAAEMQMLLSRLIAIELLKCSRKANSNKIESNVLLLAKLELMAMQMEEPRKYGLPDRRSPQAVADGITRRNQVAGIIDRSISKSAASVMTEFICYKVTLAKQLQDIIRTALVVRYMLMLRLTFKYDGNGTLSQAKRLASIILGTGKMSAGIDPSDPLYIKRCSPETVNEAWRRYKDMSDYCFVIHHYGINIIELLSADGLKDVSGLHWHAKSVRAQLVEIKYMVQPGRESPINSISPVSIDRSWLNLFRRTRNDHVEFPTLQPNEHEASDIAAFLRR